MNSQDPVAELLEELVAWTRFANQDAITATWKKVLADEKHLLAYELTDGTRTQQQVAEGCGLTQPSVSVLWQRWRRLGLVRETANKKLRHLARPSDLGLTPSGPKKGGKAEGPQS